jgi:tape measure domain-containing protein
MAKGTRGSGLDFTARLNTADALKKAKEFRAELEALKKASGISAAPVDNKGVNSAKIAQEALRKTILEGQVAAQKLRLENLELEKSYKASRISAQEMAAAEKQARNERRQLAEATKAARLAQKAANGSYDEANARLKELGRSIKAAEGGFNSTNPAIRAQISEYNKLNTALKDFDDKMGNHQRHVGNYKAAVEGALSSLKSLVLGYLSLQGALALANQSFDVALKNDAFKTSLAFTLGSAEAADEKLKDLKGTADRLGLSLTPLAATYASFAGAARAANFPLVETDKIFNSISGAAARFHLTSDQLSGSLLAIQQMISKGTVQSEELRGQLGERLPGAFSIAARAMGKNEKELGKLLETGQVLASDLLPKLAVELDKTFNLNAYTTVDSLTASTNRLSTAWDNALKSDGAGKFFKQVIEGATNAVTAIDRLLSSRSFSEVFARLFSFDASKYDKKNAVADNFASSNNYLKNNSINPTGAPNKVVVSTLTSQSLEDLEKLRTGYIKATKQAEQAVNIYRKSIQSGDLSDGGKVRLQQTEANFKALQNNLALVNTAYAEVSKNQKKVVGNSEALDKDLKTVKEINARILQLRNDALANPKNKADDILRIQSLKDRLKELNGPLKAVVDTELNARNSLQSRINELTKKGTDKQLSADEQEVESVRDKYAKMKAEAVKFNNDPENKRKGLRVDAGGLTRAQDRELVAVADKQATERLKVTLDAQKKIYDDFESYKAQVGEANAKEVYGKDLDNYESYLEVLKAKRDELQNGDQKAKGGSEIDAAANQQQLKLLDERIAEQEALKKQRERESFADAYQAAMTQSQALQRVEADYQRQVKALGDKATKEQIQNLDRQKAARIRQINEENAYAKGGFEDLMMEYDALTRESILKRLNAIKATYDAEYKAGKLNIEELKALKRPIDEQINYLNGDNIFKKIAKSVKDYREEVDRTGKDSEGAKRKLGDLFDNISEGASEAGQVVGALASAFSQLGIGGEGLQDAFKNIQGVISGAGQIAKGIASKNPVDIITGSIGLLSSAISLFDRKDKNLQKKIDGYKKELDLLGKSYAQLDRMVNNSVGESIYTDQAAQIENLRKQQAKLTQMRDAEIDKKKTDEAKVTEFQNQIDAIPGMIDDINKAISQNLIQTTFKDLSNSLADAFTEAFAVGEDAAGRFDDVFEKVIANAIKNSLKLKILDPIVKKFTDDLTAYALANNNSVIGFDFDNYKDQLKKAGELFQAGLKGSEEFFKDNGATAASSSALNNNIKSITSDQANALEGITRGTYDLTKQLVTQGRERNLIMINTNTAFANLHSVALDALRYHEQTAVNTFNTVEELKKNNKYLADIVTNTKGTSLRGGGLGI